MVEGGGRGKACFCHVRHCLAPFLLAPFYLRSVAILAQGSAFPSCVGGLRCYGTASHSLGVALHSESGGLCRSVA